MVERFLRLTCRVRFSPKYSGFVRKGIRNYKIPHSKFIKIKCIEVVNNLRSNTEAQFTGKDRCKNNLQYLLIYYRRL